VDSATAAVTRYPLDNTHPSSSHHHNARAELFDPYSFRRTRELLDLNGAHCLEIGYGAGSFAGWLVAEVGPEGSVLATDIVPMEMPTHARITVLRHDIVREPLPGTFDFIHARLVLGHLVEQREVLTKLAGALNPGGVLLVEEWWNPVRGDLVVHAPSPEAAALYNDYSMIHSQALRSNGTTHDWARRVHGAMMDDGLVDVHTDVHGQAWPGGSAGTRMQQASMAQLREKMDALGMTEELFEAVHALLDDPRLVLLGNLMCSTSGRRPR
jgi:SAM-dependent methyltransferase